MRRQSYDGLLLGTADGSLLRIFDPPWWRIDRWFGWWWRSTRDRLLKRPSIGGVVRLTNAAGDRVVRVVPDATLLPHVPRRPR